MKTKFCHSCQSNKSIDEFNKNSSRKDGLQCSCKNCDRKKSAEVYHSRYKEKHKERAATRKKELRNWLIDLKKGLCCKKCGDKRWYVLDFHHPERNKDDSVSSLVARGCSKERITKEVKKCDVLCSNCHRELHYLAGELGQGASVVIALD